MLLFALGLIVGLVSGWLISKYSAGQPLIGQFVQNQVETRKKHLDAVLALAAKQAQITNDDVQRELNVSDATATRYLETLAEFGQLTRVGQRGQSVYYTLQINR